MRVWLKVTSLPPEELPEWAVLAEELGFVGLNMGEHLLDVPADHAAGGVGKVKTSAYPYGDGTAPGWFFKMNRPDPWVALAACAAVTKRILLSSDVAIPVHEPVAWAKAIATCSAISRGRVIAGLGAGWMREEFAAVGVDFSRRGRFLDEAIAIMKQLWAGGTIPVDAGTGVVEMSLAPPLPPAPIPVMIGGSSEAAYRRAARHDGFLGGAEKLDELPQTVAFIRKEREALGRDGPFEIVAHLHEGELDPDPLRRGDVYRRTIAVGATSVTLNVRDVKPDAGRKERMDELRKFAELTIGA